MQLPRNEITNLKELFLCNNSAFIEGPIQNHKYLMIGIAYFRNTYNCDCGNVSKENYETITNEEDEDMAY